MMLFIVIEYCTISEPPSPPAISWYKFVVVIIFTCFHIEACLRLLDPITTGSGNEDKKLNSGKICQVIDQVVELPIEHQIYDIIDAAGSYGITLKEVHF